MSQLPITEVTNLIKRDFDNSTELRHILELELRALSQRDYATIDTLLTQKRDLLIALDQSALERTQLALGQSNSQSGTQTDPAEAWQVLLDEINNPGLLELWHKCCNNITACKQQNDANGQLINRAKLAVTRLLTILKGQTEIPELYDQSGTTAQKSNSRSVIQA